MRLVAFNRGPSSSFGCLFWFFALGSCYVEQCVAQAISQGSHRSSPAFPMEGEETGKSLQAGKFRVKWKRQFATCWGASLGSNSHGSLELECALSVAICGSGFCRDNSGSLHLTLLLAWRDHIRDC